MMELIPHFSDDHQVAPSRHGHVAIPNLKSAVERLLCKTRFLSMNTIPNGDAISFYVYFTYLDLMMMKMFPDDQVASSRHGHVAIPILKSPPERLL